MIARHREHLGRVRKRRALIAHHSRFEHGRVIVPAISDVSEYGSCEELSHFKMRTSRLPDHVARCLACCAFEMTRPSPTLWLSVASEENTPRRTVEC